MLKHNLLRFEIISLWNFENEIKTIPYRSFGAI